MIKHLQKIGNSRGIVLDKAILELLHIDDTTSIQLTAKDDGLFLKAVSVKDAYKSVQAKHRKSLDKLSK